MPITFVPPATVAQTRTDTMFAPRPTIGEKLTATAKLTSKQSVWEAAAGISTWRGIGDAIYSPHFDEDPHFNAFDYIKQRPDLLNDPTVTYLIERGQFDGVRNLDHFEYELNNGREFVQDIQAVSRSSHPFLLQMLTGLADPINVVTTAGTLGFGLLGVGAKTAVTAQSALAVAGKAAAIGAASNLASKELQTQLQPASNEPGVTDELVATMTGAVFGGGVGWLAHGVGQKLSKGVPTQTMLRIRRGIGELAEARFPSADSNMTPMSAAVEKTAQAAPEVVPVTPANVVPAVVSQSETVKPPTIVPRGTMVNSTPADRNQIGGIAGRPGFVFNPFASVPKPVAPPVPRPTVPTMNLDDALSHEFNHGYTPFLADVPEAHRTLFVLENASPEITKVIDDIRAKYATAGVPLNEVAHPLQGFNDLVQAARNLTNDPAWHLAATAADLDQSSLTGMVQAVENVGMKVIGAVTPGGRIANIGSSGIGMDAIVSRLNQVNQTISGSTAAVTRGNAKSPFTFMSPTAAESLKDIISHRKDMTLLDLRNVYNKAGRSARTRGVDVLQYGNEKFSARYGYGKFKEAVADYYRIENARAVGHNAQHKANVDPSIIEAANRLKKHFNEQHGRMVDVGMIQHDPASLARVNNALQRRNRLTTSHNKKLAKERANPVPDPAKIARLENMVRSSSVKASRLADRVKMAKAAAASQDWYLPRVYDIINIRRNAEAFKSDLAEGFRTAHDFDVNGNRVTNPNDRRLVASVAERIDRAALEAEVKKIDPSFSFASSAANKSGTTAQVQTKVLHEAIAQLTEGDLSPALQQAYRDQLREYYIGRAKGAYESIAGQNAEGTRQMANRSMADVDESILNRWTEQDIERLIHRAHHGIDGRWALRKAIRLSPELAGKTLSDGTFVTTEDHLVAYAADLPETLLRRMGEKNSNPNVIDPAFQRSLEDFVSRTRRDIGGMVNVMTGAGAIRPNGNVLPGMEFMGRQMLKLEYLNKMGSAIWNTINDIAPVSLYVGKNPRAWRHIINAIGALREMPTRDLHAIDAGFDGMVRSRMMGDIDLDYGGVGIQESTLNKVTSLIDSGMTRMTEVMSRVSMLDAITNLQKRVAGVVTIDYGTSYSKKLLRAASIAGQGADEAAVKAAMLKAGLGETYDVARLNKMGFTTDTSLEYHQQVYKHGLLPKDVPVSQKFATFDDYLASDVFVKPNFDEWDVSAENLKLRISAGMSREVNRFYVVTPGVGDIPLWQAKYPVLGKLFNQFQSFGLAFGNQRLAAIAQMPPKYQAWYFGMYLMLGGLSDAIKNELSGRRSLSDTAKLWEENPLGALYGASNNAGLTGWLQRPLAIADNMNLPFSPGVLTGNVTGASAARYYNAMTLGSLAGPAGSDLERGARLIPPAANSLARMVGLTTTGEEWDADNTTSALKLAPFQNLVWLRLANKASGLRSVPDTIRK